MATDLEVNMWRAPSSENSMAADHQQQQQQEQQEKQQQAQASNVMAEQQAKLQKRYGGLLPATKGMLIPKDRKFFDSGDYSLAMAGAQGVVVGSGHPQPETIPHSVPLNSIYGAIPTRRGSLSNSSGLQHNGREQLLV